MEITTTIATLTPFEMNKKPYAFTEKDFNNMVKTAPGVPVNLNFDRENIIGKVVEAWVDGKELKAAIDIPEQEDNVDVYCVPGGIIHEDGMIMLEAALTVTPAQFDLTPINKALKESSNGDEIFEIGKPIPKIYLHAEFDFDDTQRYLRGKPIPNKAELERLVNKYLTAGNENA